MINVAHLLKNISSYIEYNFEHIFVQELLIRRVKKKYSKEVENFTVVINRSDVITSKTASHIPELVKKTIDAYNSTLKEEKIGRISYTNKLRFDEKLDENTINIALNKTIMDYIQLSHSAEESKKETFSEYFSNHIPKIISSYNEYTPDVKECIKGFSLEVDELLDNSSSYYLPQFSCLPVFRLINPVDKLFLRKEYLNIKKLSDSVKGALISKNENDQIDLILKYFKLVNKRIIRTTNTSFFYAFQNPQVIKFSKHENLNKEGASIWFPIDTELLPEELGEMTTAYHHYLKSDAQNFPFEESIFFLSFMLNHFSTWRANTACFFKRKAKFLALIRELYIYDSVLEYSDQAGRKFVMYANIREELNGIGMNIVSKKTDVDFVNSADIIRKSFNKTEEMITAIGTKDNLSVISLIREQQKLYSKYLIPTILKRPLCLSEESKKKSYYDSPPESNFMIRPNLHIYNHFT